MRYNNPWMKFMNFQVYFLIYPRKSKKAFDKVCHECLVFKLQQGSIFGNLLNISEDFLRNRKQKIIDKFAIIHRG